MCREDRHSTASLSSGVHQVRAANPDRDSGHPDTGGHHANASSTFDCRTPGSARRSVRGGAVSCSPLEDRSAADSSCSARSAISCTPVWSTQFVSLLGPLTTLDIAVAGLSGWSRLSRELADRDVETVVDEHLRRRASGVSLLANRFVVRAGVDEPDRECGHDGDLTWRSRVVTNGRPRRAIRPSPLTSPAPTLRRVGRAVSRRAGNQQGAKP